MVLSRYANKESDDDDDDVAGIFLSLVISHYHQYITEPIR